MLWQRSCFHMVYLAQGCCNQWVEGAYCTNIHFQAMCIVPPNTSESIKQKNWDCIQARITWWWTAFIMHTICQVWTNNYDIFHWKQTLFGERISKRFTKTMKIWHLLCDNTFCTIYWAQWPGFQSRQWHESKVKRPILKDLLLYAKVTWEKMVKYVSFFFFFFFSQLKPSLKALSKFDVLGVSFVDVTIRASLGIENARYKGCLAPGSHPWPMWRGLVLG